MAEFRAKCGELLRFIPDLQCRKCKGVPGPNGVERNRYMCLASHALCEKDKAKCPCGAAVGENPSPMVAKMLENLPWMCKHYEQGCREMKTDAEDLEHHQQKCIYRLVFCPDPHCEREKVKFKDVIEHLENVHKYLKLHLDCRMIDGEANKWKAFFIPQMRGNICFIGKMTCTDGAVFYRVGMTHNTLLYYWIYFMGSPEEAKNYSCKISVTTKTGDKFSYEGIVNTLDEGKDDIAAKQSCLMLNSGAMKRSLNEDKRLEIEITIRNLKEEAKDQDMDSGASDISVGE